MKFFLRLLTLLFLLFVLACGAALYVGFKLLTPPDVTSTQPVEFEVVQGATGADIAHELKRQGLIEDESTFRLLLRFHPRGLNLLPGVYRMEPGLPPLRLFEQLLKAEALTRQVTFPEGLTIPELPPILKKAHILKDDAGFLEQVTKKGKNFGDLFPENLEGYLFPETYTFPYKTDDVAVVERLTRQFKDVVVPIWEKKKSKCPLGSLREVVILASLVEREAQLDSERGLIAGVYINRLRKHMLLQCDATVQYALGKPKAVLLFDDLKLESPYNTYLHEGLPPGPIANAGKKSFEAAISPTPSSYLYYVRNDHKGNGSHVFTKSYEEHLRACAQYQK